MKNQLKYFILAMLISILSITVAAILFDLYRPIVSYFNGIPFREINFRASIHLLEKLPFILGLAFAINLRKLKSLKNPSPSTTESYRG